METKNKFLRNQVKELSQKLSERNKQKERMREETGEKKQEERKHVEVMTGLLIIKGKGKISDY